MDGELKLPERCVPCNKGGAALTADEAERFAGLVPGWDLAYPRLHRRFRLTDFAAALAWVNRVGELAEREDHHPDIHLTSWNRVELELWTHAVGGLHPNDFVLARAIEEAWRAFPGGG